VNQRPINYVKSELKDLVSTIRNRYRQCLGLSDTYNKKNPFIYLNIQLEPNEYDGKQYNALGVYYRDLLTTSFIVNIEPNKTTVFFHNKQLVYNLVEKIVDKTYPSKATQLLFGTSRTCLMYAIHAFLFVYIN
jgi:DNA mismatch repair ATPase MutL